MGTVDSEHLCKKLEKSTLDDGNKGAQMMETEGKKEVGNTDYISALPDALVNHILSFLEMRQVVHTSLLSKRWRFVWKSTTSVNFLLYTCNIDPERERGAFMNFVDRVLVLRDASSMHKFTIDAADLLTASRFLTWVIAALGRNVAELHLESELDASFEMPYNLFTSEVRKLRLVCFGRFHPQLPKSMATAARIRILELLYVRLPDGNSSEELILNCPVLKSLILDRCDHHHLKFFTISAIQLESLRLVSDYALIPCKLNICCPNLKSLKLDARYQDYSMENLFALLSADIDTDTYPNAEKDKVFQDIMKVFTGIRNVSTLRLPSLFEPFADFPGQFQRCLNQFENLRTMKLFDMYNCPVSACAVASFLERLPRIESFIWDRRYGGEDEEEDWGAYLPFRCGYPCLRTVEIEYPEPNENELKFLETILKKAKMLEEVIITMDERPVEFIDQLLKLPRASSTVLVSYRSGGELSYPFEDDEEER